MSEDEKNLWVLTFQWCLQQGFGVARASQDAVAARDAFREANK